MEGAEELGMDGKDTWTGGRRPTGLGNFFQGGGAGSNPISFEDMGDDPRMGRALGSFRLRVAMQIKGGQPK